MAGSSVTTTDPSPAAPRRHSGWALGLIAAGLAISLVGMLADSNNPAPGGGTQFGTVGSICLAFYFVVYVALLIVDWSDFKRAIAAHRWFGGVPGDANLILSAVLYVCVVVPFVLPLYPFVGVVQYARGYRDQRRRYPLEQRRRIAELEAEVGIEPETLGQCPKCGKPLQVGAEFCAFCGEPVAQQARVCQKCGTAALPGAVFCPKCGAPLGSAAGRPGSLKPGR